MGFGVIGTPISSSKHIRVGKGKSCTSTSVHTLTHVWT